MSIPKLSFSALFLIAANLVPLLGVLFYHWQVGLVLGLFWIENLIIGVFNLIKMFTLAVRNKVAIGFFLCAFFVVHYGFFCIGHGLFLWELLDLGSLDLTLSPIAGSGLISEGAAILFNIIENYKPVIYMALLALVVSHMVRFVENFILKGGIFKETSKSLMTRPYSQIIIMHAGLIIGGLLVTKFGSTIWLLFIIVLFKIVVDIKLLQRRSQSEQQTLIKDI